MAEAYPYIGPPFVQELQKLKKKKNKKLAKLLAKRTNNIMREDAEEIARLERDGHTYRCACRIVWGEGECECKETLR